MSVAIFTPGLSSLLRTVTKRSQVSNCTVEELRFDFRYAQEIVLFFGASRPELSPTEVDNQLVTGDLSL